MFDLLLGQEGIKEKLNKIIDEGRVSNAYIFSGPEGVGKRRCADLFAEKLLGVKKENSPDFFLIEPKKGESSIKIDAIRDLTKEISMKPYGRYKIYIIDGAEKMTIQAQNSLLKTLEEPSSYGIIILITKNEQALLDTVRSRCVDMRFSPLSRKDIKKIMVGKNLDDERLDTAIAFSGGSVSKAIQIYEDEVLINIRNEIEEFIKTLVIEDNLVEVLRATERLKPFSDEVFKIIEVFEYIIRDMIFIREGLGREKLMNSDKVDFLKKTSTKIDISKLGRMLDVLEETEMKIKANCNFDVTIRSMALKIYEVVNR